MGGDFPKWLDQGIGIGLLCLLIWRLDSRMEQMRLILERLALRLGDEAHEQTPPRRRPGGAD
jgi:hypothetical protein